MKIEKEKKMVAEKVKDIIAENLGVEASEITNETSLMKDLKADSLAAVEIIMAMEEEFDIEIADEDAEKFDNIGDIIAYVESKV